MKWGNGRCSHLCSSDFCKRISEREKEQQAGHLSDSGSSDAEANTSEAEDSLIHHPFKLRDPSTVPNIIMNIRVSRYVWVGACS